jgi:hypothetical protein
MTWFEFTDYLLVLDGHQWRLYGSIVCLILFGFGIGRATA